MSGGARVRGEDVKDCVDTFGFLFGEVLIDGEVEGGRAPDGVPLLGEDGRPNGELGGEERLDEAQEIVGEGADEVAACRTLPRIRRFLESASSPRLRVLTARATPQIRKNIDTIS